MDYQVFWQGAAGREDISERSGNLAVTDDLDSLAVSMSLDVAQNIADPFFPPLKIACGDRIQLYHGGELVMDGQVNVVSGDYRNSLTLTAYDDGVILGKNDLIIQFNGVSADVAIRQMCRRLGIAVGELPAMPTAISKIYHDSVSVILEGILNTVTAETGARYLVRCMGGTVNVRRVGAEVLAPKYYFAANMDPAPIQAQPSAPSFKRDIEDLRNMVKIYTDKDGAVSVLASASDPVSVARYGQRMALETYSDQESAPAAQKARTRLAELNRESEEISLQTMGADEVYAGALLEFDLEEFSGVFLVKAVTKNYGHPYTMDLTLERWNA